MFDHLFYFMGNKVYFRGVRIRLYLNEGEIEVRTNIALVFSIRREIEIIDAIIFLRVTVSD